MVAGTRPSARSVAAGVFDRELNGLLVGRTGRLVVEAERKPLRSGDNFHIIRRKLRAGWIALAEDQEADIGQRPLVQVLAGLPKRRIVRLAPLDRHADPSLGQVRSGCAGDRLPAEEVQLRSPATRP